MSNQNKVVSLLFQLKNCELGAVVLCAGARNIPLIDAFSRSKNLPVFYFFDERAASFFALGLAREKRAPVAIVTTSGTALTECHSAVIEAYYQQLPLVVISADRPANHRDRGTPQSLDQTNIFGKHVDGFFDLQGEGFQLPQKVQGPLHVNICLDEPKSSEPEAYPEIDFSRQFSSPIPISSESNSAVKKKSHGARLPLVVLGPMSLREAALAKDWLLGYQGFFHAEPLANIGNTLSSNRIHDVDAFFRDVQKKLLPSPDLIIRIGGVPTGRFWRDLESIPIPLINLGPPRWPGLAREVFQCGWHELILEVEGANEDWRQWNQMSLTKLDHLLTIYEKSEPALVREILNQVNGKLYLGNSLPVRTAQLVCPQKSRFTEVWGHRGMNGIDGQISGFLGWVAQDAQQQSTAIVGDLTALYDLNALQLVHQKNFFNKQVHLFVLNNRGGQIFKKFSNSTEFIHPHQIEFHHSAKMFSWGFQKITDRQSIIESEPIQQPTLFEVCPDPKQTEDFEYEWKKA